MKISGEVFFVVVVVASFGIYILRIDLAIGKQFKERKMIQDSLPFVLRRLSNCARNPI